MATNTERFGFTLPSGQDPASVIPLNLNTQNIEKYLGMTQDMLAPLYDATEGTYEVDDIVTHDSILYKCITAIATPEEFDETKWVQTTAVSEGGGASNVEANPMGTPTDTLNTIGINGTIYGIEGSGGSGEGYTETVLFEESGSTYAGIKELSDNISKYDELIFRSIYENSQTTYEQRVSTSLIEEIGYIQNPTSSSNHISLEFGYDQSFYRMVRGENDNELNIFQVSGTRHVVTIIGVKYEGSGGSSYEETSLFSGQTASTGEGVTVNLSGNISDYDAIVIDCGRYGEGAWRHGYIWYLTSDISIGQSFLQIINANDNATAYWFYDTDTSITWASAYNAYPVTLFSIKGIKFGYGGGGSISGEGVEIYSEDEYIIGKWIDGKKLYQRTFSLPSTTILQSNDWTTINDVVVQDANKCIQTDVYLGADDSQSSVFGKFSNGVLSIFSDVQLAINAVTIRYTKTVETDAPAWGGSVTNNYASFIDTDNVIASGVYNPSNPLSYTASEDCFVVIALIANNNPCIVSVDNKEIYRIYDNGIGSITVPVPIKKGQTITATTSYSAEDSPYTVYGITYASGGSSSGSSVEYSTEEKEVGTWIDGSKIYQKTIHYTHNDTIGAGYTTIASLSNVDYIEFMNCSLYNPTDKRAYALPYAYGSNTTALTYDNGDIKLRVNNDTWNTNWDVVVTVRYTKAVS